MPKRVVVLTDEELDRVLGWFEQLAHVDAIADNVDARLRFVADLGEDDVELHAKLEALHG